MILPNNMFCLGHVRNLEPGPNRLRVQGVHFTLFRDRDRIDYDRSELPGQGLVLLEQHDLLWIYREDAGLPELPEIPTLEDHPPSQTISYDYAAPFKLVMENLYDLNHVGGTHRKTSLAREIEVRNFESHGLWSEYDLVSKASEAPEGLVSWLLLRLYIFFVGDKSREIHQRIKLLFPGLLIFDESAGENKFKSFSLLTIYPIDDTHTRIVACTSLRINPLLQTILNLLSLGRNYEIFAEDKAVLENLTSDYTRKIKLEADTPVDYARALYAEYA